MIVKCYGGPLHGQTRAVPNDHYRFDVVQYNAPDMRCSMNSTDIVRDEHRILSYMVQVYQQCVYHPRRSGISARREMLVALPDGSNLTRREECDLLHDIRRIPWTWKRPNILTDFDEWFRWVIYNKVGNREMQNHGPWFDI